MSLIIMEDMEETILTTFASCARPVWVELRSLPEDVTLQLIALLLFILSLNPLGLLFLLRLLTHTVHQPLISQGFFLSIKHTQELHFQMPTAFSVVTETGWSQ